MGKITKWVSKIHLPYTRKRVSQERIISAIKNLKPGDLILTHVDGELSSLFLSKWSHAGVSYTGLVYEATTKGVKESWLVYFLSHKDDFKVLRPQFQFNVNKLMGFLHDCKGKPYDFEFESEDDQFYCFELAAIAYMKSSNVKIEPVKTLAGHQFLAKSFKTDLFKEVHI